MEFQLNRRHAKPLYLQLAEQMQDRIRSGALPGGTRLPAVRALANDLGLTRLTVHNAYSELQASGWVEAYVGRGTFVAEREQPTRAVDQTAEREEVPWINQGMLADMMRLSAQPDLISFAQAVPATETFPVRELGRALQTALRDPASLSYGPAQGERPLREAVATWLLDRNVVTSPDQVVITSGAQQGVSLCLRAFVRQGDVVLVEEPTYLGFIERATAQGVRLIGVPLDDDGMRIDVLAQLIREFRPRLLYTVPTYHNPTGVCLSVERQQRLLQLASEHRLPIIEDDVYGALGYDGPPPLPLKSRDEAGMVVHLGSFSKILTPGLRLGYLVADADQLGPLLAAKRTDDLLCSPLLQRALADYLTRGHLAGHLRRVRTLYRERRDVMTKALEQFCPSSVHWNVPAGGLCFWLSLPPGISGSKVYTEAIERGVGVALGSVFFPQPPRTSHLRLCFAAQPPEAIVAGVQLLGQLLHDHLRQRNHLAARACRETEPLM